MTFVQFFFVKLFSNVCLYYKKKPHLNYDRQGKRKNIDKTERSVREFFCVIDEKINLDEGIGSIKKKKSFH